MLEPSIGSSGSHTDRTTVLDRIEKKFGGDRFNNPANLEKNRKLNDSIARKLKQVAKIVMYVIPSCSSDDVLEHVRLIGEQQERPRYGDEADAVSAVCTLV